VYVGHGVGLLGYKIKRGSRKLYVPAVKIKAGVRRGDLYAYPTGKSVRT
jgi:hypothetical protein